MDKGKIEKAIKDILEAIGENPNRPGLKDTPQRVARMFTEIYRGYDLSQKPKITTFNNNDDGIHYNQIIIDQGYFFSMCEHHMMPICSATYNFGYIPDKKIIGLSKVARIIDYYSAKLQIQERLGHEIVQEIKRVANPKGIILQLKATHLCKEMRGIKKVKGQMITSIVDGAFDKDLGARNEFFKMIEK